MKPISSAVFVALSLFLLAAGIAAADDYSNTITEFKKAPETKKFFESAHGYAVFPKIGKGGLGVGIAYGNGLAVFTLTRGGLMYEAAVKGQKFKFTPK